MYSVLIQNKKTIEAFQDYRPLFLKAIDRGEIGVCRWMEAGYTLDSALPDLQDLVDDKEEWRAIIVHVEDGEEMKKHARMPQNPFDFVENSVYLPEIKASEIPLVRLTHILGGLPAPDLEYERVEIREKNMAPRFIYRPIKNEEDEQKFHELQESYAYNGKRPKELILITIRCNENDDMHRVRTAWTNQWEDCSSDFWKRNNYANNSRFVISDFHLEGNTEHQADLFRFWTGVNMITMNRIDPNFLQAYRLYRMNVEIDRQQLRRSFYKTSTVLLGAQSFLQNCMKQEQFLRIQAGKKQPNYEMDVTVEMDLHDPQEFEIDPGEFGLFAESTDNDLRTWVTMRKKAENGVFKLIRKSLRRLDETAGRMKFFCEMPESEVYQLDRFQKEDMEEKLFLQYREIINEQTNLPDYDVLSQKDLLNCDENIKTAIGRRIDRHHVAYLVLLTIILLILSMIPAIVQFYLHQYGELSMWYQYVLPTLIPAAVAVILFLLWQRTVLRGLVKRYHRILDNSIRTIFGNQKTYQDFLSAVASHQRGKSYLQIMANKIFAKDDNFDKMLVHEKAVNMFLHQIAVWGRAFYLQLNTEAGSYTDISVDYKVQPSKNHLYSVEEETLTSVPFNTSGSYLESSFPFVKEFHLIREELYDNDEQY